MNAQSFSTSFTVAQSPDEVFAAILDPRAWWDGEFEGPTDRVDGEFSYRYADMHRSVQRVTELEPGRRVVWHVVESNLSFVADHSEWDGTDIVFDIAPAVEGAVLTFTHEGLTPELECFDMCRPAWQGYLSLIHI